MQNEITHINKETQLMEAKFYIDFLSKLRRVMLIEILPKDCGPSSVDTPDGVRIPVCQILKAFPFVDVKQFVNLVVNYENSILQKFLDTIFEDINKTFICKRSELMEKVNQLCEDDKIVYDIKNEDMITIPSHYVLKEDSAFLQTVYVMSSNSAQSRLLQRVMFIGSDFCLSEDSYAWYSMGCIFSESNIYRVRLI